MSNTIKICIIGAGPAGLACAIQLHRSNFNPVIIEKNEAGGLIKNASLIENYLGFPGGISGVKFSQLINEQIKSHNVDLIKDEVINLSYSNGSYSIRCTRDNYESDIVVVASGTIPNKPVEIPAEISDKVFYEVYPLLNLKNRTIVIIGGGDAAFDYGISLARNNNQVIILNRGSHIKALHELREKIKAYDSIRYHDHHKLEGMTKSSGTINLTFTYFNELKKYSADSVIFATGRMPYTGFIDPELAKIKEKLINERSLFFIGDVKNGNKRQVSIAGGDGIRCGMNIVEKLR